MRFIRRGKEGILGDWKSVKCENTVRVVAIHTIRLVIM
jgi:hypothetical protein